MSSLLRRIRGFVETRLLFYMVASNMIDALMVSRDWLRMLLLCGNLVGVDGAASMSMLVLRLLFNALWLEFEPPFHLTLCNSQKFNLKLII